MTLPYTEIKGSRLYPPVPYLPHLFQSVSASGSNESISLIPTKDPGTIYARFLRSSDSDARAPQQSNSNIKRVLVRLCPVSCTSCTSSSIHRRFRYICFNTRFHSKPLLFNIILHTLPFVTQTQVSPIQ
jgi:hypothetical protein